MVLLSALKGAGNSVQSLVLGTAPTPFVMSLNGRPSTDLPITGAAASITATRVQDHLDSGIPGLFDNVTVVGPDGGPFLFIFRKDMTGLLVSTLTTASTTAGRRRPPR